MKSLAEARPSVLSAPVKALLQALDALGEETRVVGGAVRNALLGTRIEDFDLATTLLPRITMEKAAAADWKVVPTGIEHGTVTVVIGGKPFEVTTLREDIATDGRHAEVRFGKSFQQDAARRDFTINAMSMGADGVLHDYFGGLDDLRAGRVRFIGDAITRLREDYLRGLRFFRFSATYGQDALDAEGLAAVDAERAGFARLSRERIRQEFLKLIMAPKALDVMRQAEARGLISEILGLPVDLATMALRVDAGAADGIARLFALCVREISDVALLRESLRLSNHEQKRLEALALAVSRFGDASPAQMRVMAADFPEVCDEVAVQVALTREPDFLAQAQRAMIPKPVFHLTGKDVLALGIAPGPQLGALLEAARAQWIVRGCDNSREVQIGLLRLVAN
ncbi:MAG: CCA tRNA nucleotidyltransferase [Proteobacteria bacterium]|nr:CCA tRNA nucleotidyltransferase [Pseudomonadota bacterium]